MRVAFESADWVRRPLSPGQLGIIQSIESQIEQKGGGGQIHSLTELRHPSSSLRHWHSWFSGLQIWNLVWDLHYSPSHPGYWGFQAWSGPTPLAFLGLQLADSRLWEFSASIIIWVNSSYYVCFCICYIFPILFLWRTLLIQPVRKLWL